jgi:pyrroloquinoline quinone (PQQ) biosynthesis protein C
MCATCPAHSIILTKLAFSKGTGYEALIKIPEDGSSMFLQTVSLCTWAHLAHPVQKPMYQGTLGTHCTQAYVPGHTWHTLYTSLCTWAHLAHPLHKPMYLGTLGTPCTQAYVPGHTWHTLYTSIALVFLS